MFEENSLAGSSEDAVATIAVKEEVEIGSFSCVNAELMSKYADEAFVYEQISLRVFDRVSSCSNKMEKVTELINSLEKRDYFRIKTKATRYPKSLLQYADGNASINLCRELIKNSPPCDDLFYEEMQKQLLYNAIRGHKQAVNSIYHLMGKNFDINYTDKNGMNALKIALLFNAKPKFISFLLSFSDIELDDSVYEYALNSKFMHTNTDYYIEVLIMLISRYIPKNFLQQYFDKKKQIIESSEGSSISAIWCKLEELLLVNGIEEYFEVCDHPMIMAKMWCKKLQNKLDGYKNPANRSYTTAIGCNSNKVAVLCCIHNNTDHYASLTVYCDTNCVGHKVL